MARVGYLDIIGGVSGDMLLGAMIDVGLDPDDLATEIRRVVPTGWRLEPSKVRRGAVNGTQVKVVLEDDRRWGWSDFATAVENTRLESADKVDIGRAFDALKAAESEAHDGDTSHLHELGTTDTLVDIVGAVVGFRLLGIERIIASPLPVPTGVARSSHGVTSAIAPATMSVIKTHRLAVSTGRQPVGEAVTPTGAVLVATMTEFARATPFTVESVGYGAGARDVADPPNVLGLWIGESVDDSETSVLPPRSRRGLDVRTFERAGDIELGYDADKWLLETNVDDSTGEQLARLMEVLFNRGALDVWFSPINMKKNRPGIALSVLVPSDAVNACIQAITLESTTFGVRCNPVDRYVHAGGMMRVELPGTDLEVRVRTKLAGGRVVQFAPEYEDCVAVAEALGLGLPTVYQRVTALAMRESNSAPNVTA